MKPGYKQTEVGVIPEDWEVVRLREHLSAQPRSGVNASSCPFDLRLPTYIRITDIDSAGRFNTEGKTSVDTPFAGEFRVETGDLLFARTGATVGKCYLHRERTGDFVYAGFLIRVHTKPASLDPEFLFYFCQSRVYWRWVASDSARTGQPGLNGRQYGGMLLPLPSIAEQRAIAEALSDADALIESLDTLIAKKRQIKQGAMQELLTGKRRLPGFSGEWETRFAWELGEFRSGSGFPLEHQGSAVGEFAFFKVSDMNTIENGTGLVVANHYVSDATRRLLHAFAFPPGTIMFAKVGAAVFLERKMVSRVVSCVDNNMAGFIPNSSNTEPLYMYHAFQRVSFGALVSTTALPSLNSTTLRSIRFRVPVSREEQRAIAAVLSDLDAELDALDTKLEKARAIKQGMMQELLTGRTRLVPAEVS